MKHNLLTLLLLILIAPNFFSQSKKSVTELNYRRSSLHTMLIESDNFPKKDTIIKAYNEAPFPDKYNNHTIGEKSINPNQYLPTEAERLSIASEQSKAGNYLRKEAHNGSNDNYLNSELPFIIDKYLKENRIANQLVGKWFQRQENGAFSMGLIGERGFYSASDMDANVAKASARGNALLADAGEQLINNTFVVISKLKFVDNKTLALPVKTTAYEVAAGISNPDLRAIAYKKADKAYERASEGYTVWTTSFLYQLEWNDSVAAVFYNDLWMDESSIDPERKLAFDNTDLFSLNFIGKERASSLVTMSIKEKRTEEEQIKLATVRNIDAVYSKLQKKYDVFKTKTPLYSGNPITAKIGMKEGLEGGEKFQVLEQVLDQKTGLTKYVQKGTITVNKKLIWDNRYNAGMEIEGEQATVTTFKGGKKFYSGMLIRQIN